MQRVWEGTYLEHPAMIKERFHKKYRHPTLDARLTAQRLRQEVRSMLRARKLGVPTPVLYYVDQQTNTIYMERVNGHSLKATLHQGTLTQEQKINLVEQMGVLVARLHDGDVVHGDLTSSNVLVVDTEIDGQRGLSLVLIDFGLSFFSRIPEDRAVDLYVLERAFTSAHAADGEELFGACLAAYKKTSKNWCSTLNRFAEGTYYCFLYVHVRTQSISLVLTFSSVSFVPHCLCVYVCAVRMRGRKRSMVG